MSDKSKLKLIRGNKLEIQNACLDAAKNAVENGEFSRLIIVGLTSEDEQTIVWCDQGGHHQALGVFVTALFRWLIGDYEEFKVDEDDTS